jgi:large subunit ribosomal protein L13
MRTYAPKRTDIERRWYVVDADGAVLGRLASEVARILRGKHKPIFAPHSDTGDHVIVVNARGVRLTGAKEQQKVMYRHSGYPGGLREVGYARLMADRPTLVVEKAIRGMLPKNRLGRAMVRKLQVYEGPEHPHGAQKPVTLRLGEVPAWEGLPGPRPPRTGREGPKRSRGPAASGPAAERPSPRRSTAKRSPTKRSGAGTASEAAAAKPGPKARSTAKRVGTRTAKAAGARSEGGGSGSTAGQGRTRRTRARKKEE